jgi:hypothetical protein
MAASFVSNPAETFVPAGQQLIYTLSTSATITDTFAFIVQVFESGTEIGKYYLKANSNNRAHFDLGRIIQNRTVVDTSNYLGTTFLHDYTALPYTRANAGITWYQVRIGEYTGTEALNQANRSLWVIDGYEQPSSGLHPSFADYYGTAASKKFWLTDRPAVSNVITITAGDEDEGLMAFLNRSTISDVRRLNFQVVPPTGAPITQNKTVDATNGSQVPTDVSPVNGFLTYAGVMPAQVLAMTGATAWTEIVVTPQDAAGVQKGHALRILRDCPGPRGSGTQVAFANTRGGWDFLRFDGFTRRQIRSEEKPYRKALGNYGASSFTWNSYEPETVPYQKTGTITYQLSGVFGVSDSAIIGPLLRSRQVYVRVDSRWQPVRITDAAAPYKERADGRLTQFNMNVELTQPVRC